MLNFQPIELSSVAQRLLIQLYRDDELASQKGRKARMMTSQPQSELECLRSHGLINREIELISIGQVYVYGLTELGRNYARAA